MNELLNWLTKWNHKKMLLKDSLYHIDKAVGELRPIVSIF